MGGNANYASWEAKNALEAVATLRKELEVLAERVTQLETPRPTACEHGVEGVRCDTCYGNGLLR